MVDLLSSAIPAHSNSKRIYLHKNEEEYFIDFWCYLISDKAHIE